MTNLSFAQVWSLADLIKVANMNVDDGDSFILSKGYSFESAKNEDDIECRAYTYKKTSSEHKAPYWCSYCTHKSTSNYKVGASWQTTVLEQYSNFKKQIKPAGFIFNYSNVIDSRRQSFNTITIY